MADPVVLCATGQVYDYTSLRQWFAAGNFRCPKTNLDVFDAHVGYRGILIFKCTYDCSVHRPCFKTAPVQEDYSGWTQAVLWSRPAARAQQRYPLRASRITSTCGITTPCGCLTCRLPGYHGLKVTFLTGSEHTTTLCPWTPTPP